MFFRYFNQITISELKVLENLVRFLNIWKREHRISFRMR